MNIFDLFKDSFKKHPNKTAIIYKKRCISYDELYNWVLTYAKQLYQAGIQKSNIVAIYLSNTPEAVAVTLSILSLGAIVLPINIQLPQETVVTIIKNCDAQLL